MVQVNNDIPKGNKLTYGWFSVRPRCLQFFNTPRWLLFFLSQYVFAQNVVMSGILPASVSTIERMFGFSSNMMGVLISMYDIASLLVTPFIGYLGETRRKGVWCAFGLLTLALGYFVFLIPHLILGRYKAGAALFSDLALCGSPNQTNITRGHECRKVDSSTNIGFYIVFLFAQILTGAGSVPMVVLAVPFLDENVKNKVLPIFLGWFFTAGIVGVLVGSGLSSVFLSIYVDPGVSSSLTVDDERWVGAWWLGFAIFSAVAVFWGLGIMGFPRQLPGTKAIREAAENDGNENLNNHFPVPRFVKFSEMLKATKHMFTYGSYICVTFGVCAEEFIITAIGVFLAKLIQLQFQYTSSFASILFGLVAGVSALTGNLLGAYINKRLKLNCVGAAKMCFVVGVLGCLSTIPLFLRCDNIPIAGVRSSYPNRSQSTSLISQCNKECHCTKSLQYNPMCGNGLTYYSSCHAGCTRAVLANKGTNHSDTDAFCYECHDLLWHKHLTFSNCSCVLRQDNSMLMGGEITQGECSAECGVIPQIWLTVAFLVTLFTFLNSIPASFTTLRCVPVDQRSYALALQWVLIRLLGTIPGPIVFGYLIDQACVLWDNRCGERGSCLVYNNKNLGLYVLCICFACKLISLIFFFLTWVFARKQFKRTG